MDEDLRKQLDELNKNLTKMSNVQTETDKGSKADIETLRSFVRLNQDIKNQLNLLKQNSGQQDKQTKEQIDKIEKDLQSQKGSIESANSLLNKLEFFKANKDLSSGTYAKNFADDAASITSMGMISFDEITKYEKAIKSLRVSQGLTNTQVFEFEKSLEDARFIANQLQVPLEDLIDLQNQLSNYTGRVAFLSREDLESAATLQRAFNFSKEDVAKMAADFDRIGFSVTDVQELMGDVLTESNKAGVSARKVAESVNRTLADASLKARFVNGVQDIKDMAVFSEKYKLNMETVFNAAEKGRKLDTAVEAVSQLNLLGGEFAKLDLFSFMDMSRNDPKALQKTLANLIKDAGVLNKETGEINFSSLDIDILESAASSLGVDFKEIRLSAERIAKLNVIDSLLPSNLSENQKNLIAGMSNLSKGGLATVKLDGQTIDVREITDTQIKRLEEIEKERQDSLNPQKVAAAALTTAETLQAISEILKTWSGPITRGAFDAANRSVLSPANQLAASAGRNYVGPITRVGKGLTEEYATERFSEFTDNLSDRGTGLMNDNTLRNLTQEQLLSKLSGTIGGSRPSSVNSLDSLKEKNQEFIQSIEKMRSNTDAKLNTIEKNIQQLDQNRTLQLKDSIKIENKTSLILNDQELLVIAKNIVPMIEQEISLKNSGK